MSTEGVTPTTATPLMPDPASKAAGEPRDVTLPVVSSPASSCV